MGVANLDLLKIINECINKMAGSDWKRFLGHHRKNSKRRFIETLLLPCSHLVFVDGRRLIAEVNYEKLLSDIQAKKEQGKTSEDKMARLVGKASEYKEEKLMKEHKKAWSAMVPILEKEVCQITCTCKWVCQLTLQN